MKKHTVIALDLAKSVIQVAKVSKQGELIFNKSQSPNQVRQLLANSAPGMVAMEGCGSCHYWGRLAESHGHQVRIMSPVKVKPYVSGQKTDANDAIGIAVASQQLSMSFCPVKPLEQQVLLSLNTSRRHLDKTVTALSNHIRGLLFEYGITVPKGVKGLRERMAGISATDLPELIKSLLMQLWQQYQQTQEALKTITQQLEAQTQALEPCRRLQAMEGVGPKSAALLYAVLGNGQSFKKGRDASVYVGVTPKQHSSGGKTQLVGISKQGDSTLRSTLYQGALAVISRLPDTPKTRKQQWLIDLVRRAGVKRACIALVNKTVRTAWALLRYNTEYNPA